MMTPILDWLADYGLLLAGGLMVLSVICMIIMVVLIIQAHNEFIDAGYSILDDEDEDDIRRRNNDNAILMATVAIVACM